MKTFLDIIAFLKLHFNLTSDAEVANLLGIYPSDLHKRKRLNRIPFDRLARICQDNNLSLDAMIFRNRTGGSELSLQSTGGDPVLEFVTSSVGRQYTQAVVDIHEHAPEEFEKMYKYAIGQSNWINTKSRQAKTASIEVYEAGGVLIKKDRKKLINAILFFAKYTKKCGKTKLIKLLYFLDFLFFKEQGRPVTGLDYYAWPHGPVPATLYREISAAPEDMPADLRNAIEIETHGKFQKVVPNVDPDVGIFTNQELKMLRELSSTFYQTNAEEISELTHLPRQPWATTYQTLGEGGLISYMLAVGNKSGSPLTRNDLVERQNTLKDLCESFEMEWPKLETMFQQWRPDAGQSAAELT